MFGQPTAAAASSSPHLSSLLHAKAQVGPKVGGSREFGRDYGARPNRPPQLQPHHQQQQQQQPQQQQQQPGKGGGAKSEGRSVAGGKRTEISDLFPVSRVEKSLFSVAFITTHDNELPSRLSWFLTFLEDIQWLSFPFSDSLHSDISEIAYAIPEPLRFFHDYPTVLGINALALTVVFTTIGLIACVVFLMHRQAKIPIWSLRLLRILCSLVLTTLSIPILTTFIGGIACTGPGGTLSEYNVPCSSATTLPLVIFNVLGLVAFVPLLLLGSLVFIETSPTSESPLAKAHGRVDFRAVAYRICFVFSSVFTSDEIEGWRWFHMLFITGGLANITHRTIMSQAYYKNNMTAFRAGMSLGACFAMIASMFIHGIIGSNTHGWWVAIIPAAGLGVFVGASISLTYARIFLRRTVRDWHHVIKLEAQMAEHEASLLDLHASMESSTGAAPTGAPSPEASAKHLLPQRTKSDGKQGLAGPVTINILSTALAASPTLSPGNSPSTGIPPRSLGSMPRPLLPGRKHSALRTSVEGEATGGGNAGLARDRNLSLPRDRSTSGIRAASELGTSGILSSGPTEKPPGPPMSPARRKVMMASSGHGSMPSLEESEMVMTSIIENGSEEALHDVTQRQPKRKLHVFDSPLQVEVCVRFIRENPSAKQITIGLQLLERGLLEFPRDPMLTLLAATYLSAYYGFEGERMADTLIKGLQSARNGIPLDVKFLAYSRERITKTQGSHVLDRAELDALDREVRYHHLRALTTIRDVWEAVRTAAPCSKLSELVAKLSMHRTHASTNYVKLLERNPRDKNWLRSYAQFLLLVEADNMKASQVLELAEDVEEDESHRHSGNDLAGPSTADMTPPSPHEAMILTPHYLGTEGPVHPPPPPIFTTAISDSSMTSDSPPGSVADDDEAAAAKAQEVSFLKAGGGARRRSFQDILPALKNVESGSQLSGTSASRTVRIKVQMRRMLFERFVRPLSHLQLLHASSLMLVTSIVIGFIICLQFFAAGQVALDSRFTIARNARRDVIALIENMRLMVYANSLQQPATFAAAVSTLRSTMATLLTDSLPSMAAYDSSVHDQVTKTPLYMPHSTGSRMDYLPTSYSPVEVVNTIVQAAQIALSMDTYGALTPSIWASTTDLNFISANYMSILGAVQTIPDFGVNAFNALVHSSTLQLALTLVVSILLLLATVFIAWKISLSEYFFLELRIQKLMMQLPRKVAAELVTSYEEEVENFQEFSANASESMEDTDIRLVGAATATQDAGNKPRRGKKYYVAMSTSTALIFGLLLAMYLFTFNSTKIEADMSRLYKSSNRRSLSTCARIVSREYTFADGVLSVAEILQYTRSAVQTITDLQNGLEEDMEGLNVLIPGLTILSRNCSLPGACANVQPNLAVGFPLSVLFQLPCA
ncbi:hypothetical protein BC828DRAFT_380693 [Blastocladiella britannica]|nr:hypothetical protein BC828DRAFT_380693 [Blastocladiella britannica]